MAMAETATKMRRAYFDFADMARANTTGYFPYTPPCSCSTVCAARWTGCWTKAWKTSLPATAALPPVCAMLLQAWGHGSGRRTPVALLRHGQRDPRAERAWMRAT
jgi:hypothetical protein